MRYFPVFLDLNARTVFIAGGGAAAANKLRLFAKTNATIRCVAPSFCEEMLSVFADARASCEYADPVEAEFGDAVLVIAATESDADAAIADRAARAGILVNAVDKTELCAFITPSIVDRGPVVVAIGTEGSAPVLARRLREQIEIMLPENLDVLSRLIGANRERVSELCPDTPTRRSFWENVVDGEIGRLALTGRADEAQAALDAALSAPATRIAKRQLTIVVSPNQADHLTIAALRALQDADLIVFHREVPPAILDRARRDSARVCVSKDAGDNGFIEQWTVQLFESPGRVVLLLSPETAPATLQILKDATNLIGVQAVIAPLVHEAN